MFQHIYFARLNVFSLLPGAGLTSPGVSSRHSLDYGDESDDDLKREDISFSESVGGPLALHTGLPLTPAGRSISLDPGTLAQGGRLG